MSLLRLDGVKLDVPALARLPKRDLQELVQSLTVLERHQLADTPESRALRARLVRRLNSPALAEKSEKLKRIAARPCRVESSLSAETQTSREAIDLALRQAQDELPSSRSFFYVNRWILGLTSLGHTAGLGMIAGGCLPIGPVANPTLLLFGSMLELCMVVAFFPSLDKVKGPWFTPHDSPLQHNIANLENEIRLKGGFTRQMIQKLNGLIESAVDKCDRSELRQLVLAAAKCAPWQSLRLLRKEGLSSLACSNDFKNGEWVKDGYVDTTYSDHFRKRLARSLVARRELWDSRSLLPLLDLSACGYQYLDRSTQTAWRDALLPKLPSSLTTEQKLERIAIAKDGLASGSRSRGGLQLLDRCIETILTLPDALQPDELVYGGGCVALCCYGNTRAQEKLAEAFFPTAWFARMAPEDKLHLLNRFIKSTSRYSAIHSNLRQKAAEISALNDLALK